MNIRKNIRIICILWFIVIAGSFSWNYLSALRAQQRLALTTAKSFFQQILITRKWNAEHGGVYARVTKTTQPNIYLQGKDRDLQFNSSLALTKINPAFMTRQLSEIAQQSSGTQFHITSLNPIRPANKATKRETLYLHQFELGTTDTGEFFDYNNEKYFFYMAPLLTQKICLKCHAKQGYKEGDIRGGISITLPFNAGVPLPPLLSSHIFIGLLGSLGLSLVGKKLNASYNKIQQQAVMDALTGIPNRRSFSESILRAFNRSKRDNEPLSIIMCDIDNFKKFNDTYGHAEGDKCLKKVARELQASLKRPGDFCARYGGEEFIVILANTNHTGATKVAERIRTSTMKMQIPHTASPPKNIVTISLGVATLQNNSLVSHEKLIKYADEALYHAKRSGRNRVQSYQGEKTAQG